MFVSLQHQTTIKNIKIMSLSKLNPESFKLGTVIEMGMGTYKVWKKYKNSLLVEVEGQQERIFIDFKMFKNKYFIADLKSIQEPDIETIPEEMPEGFSISSETGVIEIF